MREVAPGVFIIQGSFVNCFIVQGREGGCVLIDSGLSYWRRAILSELRVFEDRGVRLAAIVLTHGHPDHVGTARHFAERYDVPIYAHRVEVPFLRGEMAYPPPDPTIGGPHAFLTRFTDARSHDLGPHLKPLNGGEVWCASEGEVPELPGWRWMHTPGHSPGHVSLFRERDRVLLAGDAVGTANFERWRSVLSPRTEIWRGESPYICNWKQAESSVRLLARLQPEVLLCSHGPPVAGRAVAQQLGAFAERYPVPADGRYVRTGCRFDEGGKLVIPPPPVDSLLVFGAGLVSGILIDRSLQAGRRRYRFVR